MMTTAPRRSGVAAAVAVLAILIGGGAARTTAAPSAAAVQSSDTPAEVSPGGWASPTSAPIATGGRKTGGRKVLVIVDENHTQHQVQAGMPYLVRLQKTFGVTTHHTAATHTPRCQTICSSRAAAPSESLTTRRPAPTPSRVYRCSGPRWREERPRGPTTRR